MKQRSKWSLIGIPDHEAVLNLGGRVGAMHGPGAFRSAFRRFSGRDPVREHCVDFGDVGSISSNIEKNHQLAAQLICEAHIKTQCSIIIGGSHDHGHSHLLGIRSALARSLKKREESVRLGCLNLDAHLDVRTAVPRITSGSPFYLAIESGTLSPKRFIEFGIQRHCNAAALWQYIDQKKITVIPYEKLRGTRGKDRALPIFQKALKKLCAASDAVVLSFDLDCVAEAFAPGVSAPQSEGFTPQEILSMLEFAAKLPKVVSLGIFELNPEHDIDSRTARLAAKAADSFIASRFSAHAPSAR